jgi:hypothetical protein
MHAVARRRATPAIAALAVLVLAIAWVVSTGSDARGAATGSISGTISLGAGVPEDDLQGVTVKALNAAGSVIAVDSSVGADGAYSVTGLLAGDYRILFDKHLYSPEVIVPEYVTEFFNDVYTLAEATVVTVGEGEAVTGKDATLDLLGHFTVTPTPTIKVASIGFGSVLGSATGVWKPAPDEYSFQWNRDGSPVPGATDPTYELTEDDQNTSLTLTVTAHKEDFPDTEQTSSPLALALFFDSTPTPTVTGTAKAGYTLTANKGTWVPTPATTFQWKRNGVPIDGATSSTYVLKTLDRGSYITVTVTGTKSGYSTTSRTSANKFIPKVFTTAPAPTITGTARAGYTLTAHRGTWVPTPTTITYQWYRNGVKITGATKYTYKLTSLDRGKKIVVKVTGKKSLYLTTIRASAAKSIAP